MKAKFTVDSITQFANIEGVKVEMYPVMDLNGENREFWKAVPNGKIEMMITTPEATSFFEVGKNYYVEFSS